MSGERTLPSRSTTANERMPDVHTHARGPSTKTPLYKSIHHPPEKPENSIWGSRDVPRIQSEQISGDINETPHRRTLETIRWNRLEDVLHREIRQIELPSVRVF